MIVALAPRRQRDAPIALELFRLRMLVKQLRSLSGIGGQIVVTSHAPDVLRCFRPDETVLQACGPAWSATGMPSDGRIRPSRLSCGRAKRPSGDENRHGRSSAGG